MLLLAASLAHAGLRADVQEALAAGPDAVVACTSGAEAMHRVGDLMESLAKPIDGDTLVQLEGLLGDDRPAGLSWWKESNVMELRFSGADGIDAVRARMGAVGLEVGADGAVLEKGEQQGTLEVRGGVAYFRSGALPTALPHELPSTFLDHLGETAGCAVYAHVPYAATGPMEIAFHLPFTPAAPASWALVMPQLQTEHAMDLTGAPPAPVSTREAPAALMTLGFGLADVDFKDFLKGKELTKARRLQHAFPLAGGTTVAFFGGSATPTVAGVLPFARNISGKALMRRVWIGVKDLEELQPARIDATHVRVQFDKIQLFLTADKGRIWLATDPATLNTLQAGLGTPWVTGDLATLAEAWPIVFSANGAAAAAAGLPPLPRPLYFTMDLEGGVAYGLVDLPITVAELMQLGSKAREMRQQAVPRVEETH